MVKIGQVGKNWRPSPQTIVMSPVPIGKKKMNKMLDYFYLLKHNAQYEHAGERRPNPSCGGTGRRKQHPFHVSHDWSSSQYSDQTACRSWSSLYAVSRQKRPTFDGPPSAV